MISSCPCDDSRTPLLQRGHKKYIFMRSWLNKYLLLILLGIEIDEEKEEKRRERSSCLEDGGERGMKGRRRAEREERERERERDGMERTGVCVCMRSVFV